MCSSTAPKLQRPHVVVAGFDTNRAVTIVGWASVPAGRANAWCSSLGALCRCLEARWLIHPIFVHIFSIGACVPMDWTLPIIPNDKQYLTDRNDIWAMQRCESENTNKRSSKT
ncbi:hypothetical protein XU18_1486 [Perkinsela sp. CCAP 1560/4]|nr:hypothetical protein XU18_1486 [Perkinsela sp. CCAP 1560/4]|eukprot:KNH07900.1 hypothetical protein XU18_1486 [Perkinsela sp. CCAP 1560/4]